MRTRSLFVLLVLVAAMTLPSAGLAATDAIKLVVNGREIPSDPPPQIIDGTTLVPLRFVAEALGAGVSYDPGGPGVVIDHPGQGRFYLHLQQGTLTLPDGTVQSLAVPAQIIDSRTFVPLRLVAESFGANVAWDGATRTVTITLTASRVGSQPPGQGSVPPPPGDPGSMPPPGGKGSVPPPPGGMGGGCPIPDPNGPCFHKIYAATSSDGKTWVPDGKLLFDQTSVPGAIVRDGTIYLYFVDPGQGGMNGLSVAISTDGGASFQRQPIQLADQRGMADPDPVLLADGRIRLYYFGGTAPPQPGADPNTSPHHIQSAVSRDGVHFTREEGVRFTYNGITDPDVFQVGASWVMLASQGRMQIRSTSDDGLTFTDQDQVNMGGAVSSTFPVGGMLTTFYCDASGGISAAQTKDGATWGQGRPVLQNDNPKQQVLCDPTVVQLPGGTYKLFYKVGPAPTFGAQPGKPGQPATAGTSSPPAWPDSSCVAAEPSTYFRAVHAAGPWGANKGHFQEQPREWFDYLKSQNVNWVGVSPVWYLQGRQDDSLTAAPETGFHNGDLQSWPDDGLRTLVRRLRCQGFHVFFGLAAFEHSLDGQYRRYEYWPTVNFQQSYTEYVLHYARLAQEEKVELLSIGTEMDTAISPHWAGWVKDLLSQVRTVYQGAVSYDQHYSAFLAGPGDGRADARYWWEFSETPQDLWQLDFDYIGISVYDLTLEKGGDNSLAAQTIRWQKFFDSVRAAHEKYGKPVLFLEVGQDNIDPADIGQSKDQAYARAPTQAGYQLQSDVLQGLFQVADPYDWFHGGFLWEYWVMGDAECQAATCKGIGYTTRGKPADDAVRQYYAERKRREEGGG